MKTIVRAGTDYVIVKGIIDSVRVKSGPMPVLYPKVNGGRK